MSGYPKLDKRDCGAHESILYFYQGVSFQDGNDYYYAPSISPFPISNQPFILNFTLDINSFPRPARFSISNFLPCH